MNIDPINNGIVIDHIKAGEGMTVYTHTENVSKADVDLFCRMMKPSGIVAIVFSFLHAARGLFDAG